MTFLSRNFITWIFIFWIAFQSSNETALAGKRKKGHPKGINQSQIVVSPKSDQNGIGQPGSEGQDARINGALESLRGGFEQSVGLESSRMALTARFHDACTEKFEIGAFCKKLVWAMGQATGGLVAGQCTAMVSDYLQGGAGSEGTRYASATVFSAGVLEGIRTLVEAIKNCKTTPKDGMLKLFDEIEIESQEQVRHLPKDLQERINSIDIQIKNKLGASSPDGKEILNFLISRMIYTRIPSQLKDIAQFTREGDLEKKAKIDQSVESLIATRPVEERDRLRLFIQQIRDNSVSDLGQHSQAYLVGPPGTGKTTFAEQIGKALGIDVCVIKISELKEVADIFGTMEKTSPLLDCMIKSKYKNQIIVLDEAGTYFRQPDPGEYYSQGRYAVEALKTMLDRKNQIIKLTNPVIQLDASRVAFVLTGNYELKDLALLDRMPVFRFDRLEDAQKDAAVEAKLRSITEEWKAKLDSHDFQNIVEITHLFIPYLKENDKKLFPGARVLEDVTEDLFRLIRTEYFSNKSKYVDDSEFKIEQFSLDKKDKIEKIILDSLQSRLPAQNR